jgi:hypothetical protein
MVGKTIENIQECFGTLLKQSYTLIGATEDEKQSSKTFYQTCMETFAQWSQQV